MNTDISPAVREKAPLILAEIQKAKSILLHCHPSPDPDSVGSALAMKFAIEQLGLKATVIKGDSEIPQAFMHFPGATDIVMKSWWEIDQSAFDLFIIVDSSVNGVSRIKPPIIPASMHVINIDHHRTNEGLGNINLTDPSYPATGQLLFDVLTEMNIHITSDIATNLFMGIYTDTGGFKYTTTSARTFRVAAELAAAAPHFSEVISTMENSETLGDIAFQGAALSSIETFFDGRMILSVVPHATIKDKHIPDVSITAGTISSILRRVGSCDIAGALIEQRPGKIKISFRSIDGDRFDVSKLAAALGGGGHKNAAGIALDASLADATKLVVEKAKELYNLVVTK